MSRRIMTVADFDALHVIVWKASVAYEKAHAWEIAHPTSEVAHVKASIAHAAYKAAMVETEACIAAHPEDLRAARAKLDAAEAAHWAALIHAGLVDPEDPLAAVQ